MSGRTRSTPRCSSRGNASPASIAIRSSPYSRTVMFFPTSPSPPSGMIRSGVTDGVYGRLRRTTSGALRDGSEEAEAAEAVADRGGLVLVGLDERQTHAADVVPEELERLLDRDRVRLDAEQLDRRPELLVERAGTVDVALAEAGDHLLHPRSDDMRVHAHAADPADLEERQDEIVVARVEVEPARDHVARRVEAGLCLLHGADVRDLREPRDRL